MSWSEVFPILSDEHVDAFEAGVSEVESGVLEGYFSVTRVINARPEAKHVVSTSLFWKNIRTDMPEIKIRSRKQFMKPGKKLLRFDPWSYYTVPLLQGAYWISKKRPEAVLRVYLAADLEFLIPDLEAAGIEIYLMESNSIAHNPGALWRFLAFAEPDKLVTVLDAERVAKPGPQMDQTVEMDRMGLGWWRVPVWGELNEIGNVSYRPFVGCHLGRNQALPVELLMKALIWCTQQD